jgi:glycosyltransferase involved in cell wall biosynthesis
MKIILIGNYPPDKQESMRLFSNMLEAGFREKGFDVSVWLPKVIFGHLARNTSAGFGKWLGYMDKWLLFPMFLKFKVFTGRYKASATRFHVCDHSNSPYLSSLPRSITAITCHDVLAIRGALGFKDAYCEASRLGIILQKWILGNLVKAERLATVSMFTMTQLRQLDTDANTNNRDWRVIPNAFNEDFYPLQRHVTDQRLTTLGIKPGTQFLLHVGSSLPRKNRKLLVEMLAKLGETWNGMICFAGQAIDPELMALINHYQLGTRVISIVNPVHADLLALYTAATAFVFPSYSEGFGWPVIEAQACGTPVLASNLDPMPEVSGVNAALLADPDNATAFAEAFMTLSEQGRRDELVNNGFENSKRFARHIMINSYLDLHQLKIA